MTVALLNYTPLWVTSNAIRKCWGTQDKADTFDSCPTCSNDVTANLRDDSGNYICPKCGNSYLHENTTKVCGVKDLALIDRVANKHKHSSTIEHLYYNFEISGVSRALLQELSRHRIASPTVKSSRYTLKELKDEESFVTHSDNHVYISEEQKRRAYKYVVSIDHETDFTTLMALDNLRLLIKSGKSNDKAKYAMPEAYKTELSWSINARSLQNLLKLRTDKSALQEIRELAWSIHDTLPEDHKFLFEDITPREVT